MSSLELTNLMKFLHGHNRRSRPKDVQTMVEGNIVSTATDPTADNVVCISTSIMVFGGSWTGLPSVRVDADMKLGSL